MVVFEALACFGGVVVLVVALCLLIDIAMLVILSFQKVGLAIVNAVEKEKDLSTVEWIFRFLLYPAIWANEHMED
jgi:hypothetical protein